MTLDELIEELTSLRDEEGVAGSAMVMLAMQPSYPLQTSVRGPVVSDENTEEADFLESRIQIPGDWEDEEDLAAARAELERLRASPRPIVYLLEGHSRPVYGDTELSPYASRDLWDR